MEGIESAILAAEQEVEGIEARLHDADFQLKHFEEIPGLVEKNEAAKAVVAGLYQRWEELEALRVAYEG